MAGPFARTNRDGERVQFNPRFGAVIIHDCDQRAEIVVPAGGKE